jgi:hypothetical protein
MIIGSFAAFVGFVLGFIAGAVVTLRTEHQSIIDYLTVMGEHSAAYLLSKWK